MNDASDIRWITIAPGVMALPTTKFRIHYVNNSHCPFRASWDGELIYNGLHVRLVDAQRAVETHMAQIIEMGIDP